jgi:hypothetical protein
MREDMGRRAKGGQTMKGTFFSLMSRKCGTDTIQFKERDWKNKVEIVADIMGKDQERAHEPKRNNRIVTRMFFVVESGKRKSVRIRPRISVPRLTKPEHEEQKQISKVVVRIQMTPGLTIQPTADRNSGERHFTKEKRRTE